MRSLKKTATSPFGDLERDVSGPPKISMRSIGISALAILRDNCCDIPT